MQLTWAKRCWVIWGLLSPGVLELNLEGNKEPLHVTRIPNQCKCKILWCKRSEIWTTSEWGQLDMQTLANWQNWMIIEGRSILYMNLILHKQPQAPHFTSFSWPLRTVMHSNFRMPAAPMRSKSWYTAFWLWSPNWLFTFGMLTHTQRPNFGMPWSFYSAGRLQLDSHHLKLRTNIDNIW